MQKMIKEEFSEVDPDLTKAKKEVALLRDMQQCQIQTDAITYNVSIYNPTNS